MMQKRLDELYELVKGCVCTHKEKQLSIDEALHLAYTIMFSVKKTDNMVYIIGNGGSAGIASHFHCDLLKSLEIPSSTLFDTNVLTCLGNDYGYEHIFSAALNVKMKKQDVLVAISSSGKSQNILNAVQMAQKKNAKVITLTGFSEDNPLRQSGDLNFYLNQSDYGLVEAGHFFLLHTLVDLGKIGKFSLAKIKNSTMENLVRATYE
jgi:D-sedoheptulose 7-phosphate isomerase